MCVPTSRWSQSNIVMSIQLCSQVKHICDCAFQCFQMECKMHYPTRYIHQTLPLPTTTCFNFDCNQAFLNSGSTKLKISKNGSMTRSPKKTKNSFEPESRNCLIDGRRSQLPNDSTLNEICIILFFGMKVNFLEKSPKLMRTTNNTYTYLYLQYYILSIR